MKLFIEFNESEANHLKTLEAGQRFGKKQKALDLDVRSEGEMLQITVRMDEMLVGRHGLTLGCELPKSAIKAGEKLIIFNE